MHIHGPYSRATSKNTSPELLEKYARMKGLDIIGTGDFTHPKWLGTLKKSLTEDGTGVLKSSSGFSFMLSGEVANIYSQGGKLRKVHNVIISPDFDTVDQINDLLGKKGKLASDGRPIFGKMPCTELVESLMAINPKIAVIPAHVWTPWFGVLGSKSGFDSIEECFQDQSKHIFAIETGLSSDPGMNWRVSSLDGYALVSNSDAHSYWPWRIGREANVFSLNDVSYGSVMSAIKEKNPEIFLYTVEVDPSYGKYHFDGHRDCGVCLSPSESLKKRGKCPKCAKLLTIGVLSRVEELADRKEGYVPKNSVPFRKLLPLTEILSVSMGTGQMQSKKLWSAYNRLIMRFGSEFGVLLDAEERDIEKSSDRKTANIISMMRSGKMKVEPGYDGVYGKLNA